MQADRLENQRFPGYGECIYCGISEEVTKLTDEHVVAFALGGNVIIENASCEACQAVARFGLRGFRSLVLPKLILGRYPHIRYFVGSDPDAEPPPRLERSILHAISFEEVGIGNMRLILAAVRLFANSGTDRAGPPIYRVIVGAPLSPRARRS